MTHAALAALCLAGGIIGALMWLVVAACMLAAEIDNKDGRP